jgi:hypothetical protein
MNCNFELQLLAHSPSTSTPFGRVPTTAASGAHDAARIAPVDCLVGDKRTAAGNTMLTLNSARLEDELADAVPGRGVGDRTQQAKLRRSPLIEYCPGGKVTFRPEPPRRSQMLKPSV